VSQPPKPLFDRLPAIPSRPSSRPIAPIAPNPAREDAAHKRLKARLKQMAAAELEPPGVDPRTAAVSALMVANFTADEQVRKRFAKFVAGELLDSNAIEDLPIAARLVLRILQKLGVDLDQRGIPVPADLLSEGRVLRERLIRVAERFLADIDEANGRLVTVRLGEGPADTVYDLRMLAGLCREHAATLASEAGTAYSPDLERDARATAQRIEDALVGEQSNEEREWRAYLLRALVMLVPLYEEVCRAGRFLFHDEQPEIRFPSLASVARVRRRVKRESARRSEMAPAMPAVRSVSLIPPGGSIPPEASLVEVSPEREQAIAGALEAALPEPRAMQMDALEAAALAPAPVRLEALEVVRLDFGGGAAASDPNVNLETPDLELDLGYRSESNFYTDVLGTGLGLFIATFVVKPPGTPLVARLTLPEHPRPFIVSGTVQWVLEFKPSIEAPPGIGLLLRPVEGAPKKAIEEFMKVRLPILHDE
jgi:hypothetical protein